MQLQIERGNSMKLDEDKLSTAIKSREIIFTVKNAFL